MRDRFPCLALAVLLFCPFASAQWFTQASGTTRDLYGVSFSDANLGTVVGDSGTILRTTNGGATWTTESSRTTKPLRGISLTDTYNGTVVGDSGTILRTTDGGANWLPQSSGTTLDCRGVCFTDARNGTVVGGQGSQGIVLRTTNGGATWVKQFETDSAGLNSVSFSDSNSGTAVGGGWYDPVGCWYTILRTTDGGTTWKAQNGPQNDILRSVVFTDSNTGTAVGGVYGSGDIPYTSYVILRTTDGGVAWTTQKKVTRAGGGFNGIFFTDANTGTAVGYPGYCSSWSEVDNILRTTDGGATWVPQSSGTTMPLRGVCFVDANTGTVVGDSGTILHTTNGGVTSAEEELQHQFPQRYLLRQNYPNPFNPSTVIGYTVGGVRSLGSGVSNVRLVVYDLLGREVRVLVNEKKAPGSYEVTFDGANLASGIYIYRMNAGRYVESRKMILMR
jgi:photosystem II stability/assembly factor-like uncharacterized protein